MNIIERRQYEMLVRVRDFGDNHGQLFPGSSVAREGFTAVAAAIQELDTQDLRHLAASASALLAQKTRTRDALHARLQAIGQTARVLAEDAPGLDEQFPMPAGLSDQSLLTTGRKFARDVEPFTSQFIAHGMPVTFVADLNALVDGFDRAVRDRGLGRETRHAARASTKAAFSSGLAAVRRLNAVVINHLCDDEVTTTVWEQARRGVYPERSRRTGATPAPAAAGAAPASSSGNKAA